MPDRPLQVEIVSHPGRKEVVSGLASLLMVGAVVALQWWVTTPGPERTVQLRKLGLSRCRMGKWHYRGTLLAWPPSRCACLWPEGWPVQPDPEAQLKADQAERKSLETQ